MMAMSDYERTQLFNWCEEHMGTELARTMMTTWPPVGWDDIATRRDLQMLEDRLDRKIERLDARFDRVDTRLEAMAETMAKTMATKADVTKAHIELTKNFVTWLFAAQAIVVSAIGLLFVYLG